MLRASCSLAGLVEFSCCFWFPGFVLRSYAAVLLVVKYAFVCSIRYLVCSLLCIDVMLFTLGVIHHTPFNVRHVINGLADRLRKPFGVDPLYINKVAMASSLGEDRPVRLQREAIFNRLMRKLYQLFCLAPESIRPYVRN